MKVTLGTHPEMNADLDHLQKVYEDLGVEVKRLRSVDTDSVFHRDVMAWTPFGLIKCRMGKLSRAWEPERWFEVMELAPVLSVMAPGNFEGADLLWQDRETAIVAIGPRTNMSGAEQVQDFLEGFDVDVTVVPVPGFHDQHLLGVANRAGGRNFAIDRYVSQYRKHGVVAYGVANAEYDRKGINWVEVGNTVVGNKAVSAGLTSMLTAAGCRYRGVPINNLLRFGGGVACATGIYER